jgi:hypothetical protein
VQLGQNAPRKIVLLDVTLLMPHHGLDLRAGPFDGLFGQ